MSLPVTKALLVVTSFLFLVSPLAVHASTYWVSPAGQSCQTNQCDCTETKPCELNPSLLNQLQPGDQVQLHAGLYSGFVINALHGTAEKNITFSGPETGLPAHIKGEPGQRDAIELRRSSHLVLQHIKVTDAPRSGIRLNNSHHITVRNTTLEQNGVWGIFTNHSNHFYAHHNTIIGPATEHGIYQSNSGDHVSIIGNYIINFDRCAVHFNGDLSMGGGPGVEGDGIISDIEIRDNFFAGNGRDGGSAINLDGVDGGIISNNILFDNTASGIAVYKYDGAYGSKNIHIERNLIIMPPESRFALNFNHSEGNNVVQHNLIIAQHASRGIYDARPVELSFNRSEPITGLPFEAQNNGYSYQGLFALFNNRRRVSFQQWQDQQQETGSTLLSLEHMLMSASPDYRFALPANLTQFMQQHQIAVEHPYLHLIDMAHD